MPVFRDTRRFAFVTPNARFHENEIPGPSFITPPQVFINLADPCSRLTARKIFALCRARPQHKSPKIVYGFAVVVFGALVVVVFGALVVVVFGASVVVVTFGALVVVVGDVLIVVVGDVLVPVSS